MRAVRCVDGVPSLVDAPAPSGEGVKVRVVSAGICGSDLHLLAWNLPVVMGHELAGTLADGTPVAVEPIAPCWECRPCRDGAYNRCVQGPAAMVMGVGRDGGMAEECMVPVDVVARCRQSVALEDACLVEPLAVAVHGVRQGRIGADRAGRGRRGRLHRPHAAVIAAQAVGATVDLEARHDRQREAADRLGAGTVDGDVRRRRRSGRDGQRPGPGRRAVPPRRAGRPARAPTGTATSSCPGMEICTKEVELVPAMHVLPLRAVPGLRRGRRHPGRPAGDRSRRSSPTASRWTPPPKPSPWPRDRAAGAIKVVLEP